MSVECVSGNVSLLNCLLKQSLENESWRCARVPEPSILQLPRDKVDHLSISVYIYVEIGYHLLPRHWVGFKQLDSISFCSHLVLESISLGSICL